MQELSKSHAALPSIKELTHTLRELAAKIAPHGTFNFLLSNGEALWAHATTHLCYVERQHPFAQAQLADEDLSVDFSRETTPQDKVAIIVTAPLGFLLAVAWLVLTIMAAMKANEGVAYRYPFTLRLVK